MDYNCTLRHRMFQMPAAFPRSHPYCGAFILFNKLPFSINGSELKGHSSKDLINHKLLHRQSLYAWLFQETAQEQTTLYRTPLKENNKEKTEQKYNLTLCSFSLNSAYVMSFTFLPALAHLFSSYYSCPLLFPLSQFHFWTSHQQGLLLFCPFQVVVWAEYRAIKGKITSTTSKLIARG